MGPEIERILAQIDREELADLALSLGNIDSPVGREQEVGQFAREWLRDEGFFTRVVALAPHRPNVVGTWKGSGGGYSLLFNSHLDTSISERDVWVCRDRMNPYRHRAWREGETIHGEGILNDKGMMACFMIAAKAIVKSGVILKGDLILTGVSGEIEQEPVDEFQGLDYLGQDVGTRYMVTHGVVADYAIVAESVDFRIVGVQAGRAVFKITVFTQTGIYAPFINRPYTYDNNPNAIVKMARLIDLVEDWAFEYETKHRYTCPGGTLVPKVSIGAIRGGGPYLTCMTAEMCSLYLDIRTAPNQNVLSIQRELEGLAHSLGLNAEIELYVFRRGYESKNANPLVEAISRAHRKVLGEEPKPPAGPICSMWQDINTFNEMGIPAISYGPGRGLGPKMEPSISIDELYQAAQIYAMIAVDICNQEKVLHGA